MPQLELERFWRDKNGRIVIWQTPNLLLIGWAVLTFISLLVSSKSVADFFSWAGVICLVVWALLEIFKGVNYFRRLLGLVVAVLMVLFIIKNI